MDQLIKQVTARAGISEKPAEQAVEVVVDFLKERLPAPIGGQLEALLGGDGDSGQAENLLSGLGGLLGKK